MSDARYVVLHHTGHGPDHYDFLLATDADGPLLTWRLARWPVDPADAVAAEPLPPHRRAYLTYEGEVSGGRGRVRRVAEGVADGVTVADDAVGFRLDGRQVFLPTTPR